MKDMKIRFAAALLALGLATAPAVPAFAAVSTIRDAQGVAHLNLDTQLIPQHRSGFYGGSLQLTITPDGIVNGYYRPDDGSFHTVTGGLNGNQIWFDIGYQGGMHITGTLTGDQIVGGTFIGDRLFDFKAFPKKD
jgi:hypothetical protein